MTSGNDCLSDNSEKANKNEIKAKINVLLCELYGRAVLAKSLLLQLYQKQNRYTSRYQI